MNKSVRFFLGSNSCRGFYSLYKNFTEEPAVEALYIIKGGAGCGKSSFMRSIASALADEGFIVEYIACSGDPESLDGIFIPALKTAYLDGTSPHIIEPVYPGVRDFYINLGVFYDNKNLSDSGGKIKEIHSLYKGSYARAYNILSAAGSFENGIFDGLIPRETREIINKRTSGIITREIKKTGHAPGSTKLRFLSSISCNGRECLFNTAELLCEKLYAVENDYGLSAMVLESVCSAAINRGWDVIICPSPLKPDEIEHLLIPELSLGFLSVTRGLDYEGDVFKRLRLNSLADKTALRGKRARLKSDTATLNTLYEKGIEALNNAKQYHDILENLYNPHVDFGGVYALAEAHTKALLQRGT